MKEKESVLVIAFDGLDYELIQEFGLENIKLDYFDRIDNSSNIKSIKTSELFASFITGTNYEEHSVTGYSKWPNPYIRDFEEAVEGKWPFTKFKTFRKALYSSFNSKDFSKQPYMEEDLTSNTLFDEINNSRPMFIPSFNPSDYWASDAWQQPLKKNMDPRKMVKLWETREFSHRKKMLFRELDIFSRDFLMMHIHYPDIYQHIYGDVDAFYNKNKLRKMYREIDDLAKEIKESSNYDIIIFMSDHGLPTKNAHNENAFYSSNKKLFDEEPHITDFYDKILDFTQSEGEE